MSEKTEAINNIQSVGDQINSVVDNLAHRLEAPVGVLRDIADKGFDSYCNYIWADGLSNIVVLLVIMAVSIIAYVYVKEYGKDEWKTEELGIKFIVSTTFLLIIIISCLVNITKYSSQVIYPEGYVIKEIMKSL